MTPAHTASDAPTTSCPTSIASSIPPRAAKADINRVRKAAERQGLWLHKVSATRCWWSYDYEKYVLYPIGGGRSVFGYKIWSHDYPTPHASLEDVELWLTERVTPAPSPSKALENRIRRAAARMGLELHRPRRRDRRALDYGTYQLVGADGERYPDAPATLDVIEGKLRLLSMGGA
ncbi:MAG: hypothetical protein JWP35_4647 [Caulobacter sp.]|nr:hypothetical protein [Caulobacter sp.]